MADLTTKKQYVAGLLRRKDWTELETQDPAIVGSVIVLSITSLVGSIPPDLWKSLRENAEIPCGKAGCDCERVMSATFEGLEVLRNDFREQVVTRGLS